MSKRARSFLPDRCLAAVPQAKNSIRARNWPKLAGFCLWRMTLLDEVALLAAKPQRACERSLEAQAAAATFESLRTTGDDVATLVAKLVSLLDPPRRGRGAWMAFGKPEPKNLRE